MQIEKIAIDRLLLDPANARKHGKKNIDAIKGSLARFGQQKPIVINAENIVIAGNGTLEAAKELGWKEIKIIRTDLKGSDLTAFGLADNRTSELAEWNEEIRTALIDGLVCEGYETESLGLDFSRPEELSAEKIKNLNDAEFEKEMEKHTDENCDLPIVPQFFEEHDCFIIPVHNKIDSDFIRDAFNITGNHQSESGDKKVRKTTVISVEAVKKCLSR